MKIRKNMLVGILSSVKKVAGGSDSSIRFITDPLKGVLIVCNTIAKIKISAEVSIDGAEEMDVVLDGSILLQAISKMSGEEIEIIHSGGNTVKVSSDSVVLSLQTQALDSAMLPDIVTEQSVLQPINLDTNKLRKYVDDTAHFLGNEAKDIRMGTYHVELTDMGNIRVTALDSCNISIRGGSGRVIKDYVIHGHPLREALSIITKNLRIGVPKAEEYITLCGEGSYGERYTVSISSMNGPFYNLEKVFEAQALTTLKAKVNRAELMRAVSLASIFDKIQVLVRENTLTVQSSQQLGSVQTVIPLESNLGALKDLTVLLKGQNLLKALQSLDGETVCLTGGSSSTPVFLSSSSEECEILLPMLY